MINNLQKYRVSKPHILFLTILSRNMRFCTVEWEISLIACITSSRFSFIPPDFTHAQTPYEMILYLRCSEEKKKHQRGVVMVRLSPFLSHIVLVEGQVKLTAREEDSRGKERKSRESSWYINSGGGGVEEQVNIL